MPRPSVILLFLLLTLGGYGPAGAQTGGGDSAEVERLIARSQKNEGINPGAALSLAQDAIALALKTGHNILLIHAYTQMGKVYNYMNYHEKALEVLLKAVEICIRGDLQKELGDSYNQVGGVFYNQADYKMAEEYFTRALHIREFQGDREGMAASLNNVGESFRLKGDDKTALIYYTRALEINEAMGNKLWLSINCDNIGNLHLQRQDYALALEFFQKQLSIVQEGKLPAFSPLCNLGNYCLRTGDPAKAIGYFKDALADAQRTYATQGMIDALKGLSEAHARRNEFSEAFASLQQYMLKKDSLRNNEKERQLLEMNLRFEMDQKEREQEKAEHGRSPGVDTAPGFSLLTWILISGNAILAGILLLVLVRKKG
jgi:tetratricopeptide (TPR) repeat protein